MVFIVVQDLFLARIPVQMVVLEVLAVLVALAAAWVVIALNPGIAEPATYSLPMRRLLGFLASALDASVIPVMAYLVGLFTWALNGF